MSTQYNLPPPPAPDTHCFDDDENKDVWSHSKAQLQAYAIAAIEQDRAARVPNGLTRAVIGQKHFGNPIPQEWYQAAHDLLAAAPQPQPVQKQPSVRMWHDRIKDKHPNSEPEYWPSSLKAQYMESEILDLRALVATQQKDN